MARLTASKFGIELNVPPCVQKGTWLVDKIGETYQDFAIIEPCIAELGMPNGLLPPLLTDPWPWHRRRFTRRIAIAMNEVTIEQFRVFDPRYFAEVYSCTVAVYNVLFHFLNIIVSDNNHMITFYMVLCNVGVNCYIR